MTPPTGIHLVTGEPKPMQPIGTTKQTIWGVHQFTWHYSETQQSRRFWDATTGEKTVRPFRGTTRTAFWRWKNTAQGSPWPLYFSHQPEPSWRDRWLLESEGEKCVDVGAAAGYPGISQPGFNRRQEHIRPRYRELKSLVAGVVYIADNDKEGRRKAKEAQEAADAVGLPLRVVHLVELFPDLPEGGAIDDVPDVAAAMARIEGWLQQQPEPTPEPLEALPEPEPPSQVLLSEVPSRAAFTFDRLLPPDLAEAAGYLSASLTADPLIVSLFYLVALSGALAIGTRVESSATYSVPINEYLALIAGSGSAKSNLYDEFLERAFADVLAYELREHKNKELYWRQQDPKERGDRPQKMLPWMNDWNNASALDLELERHANRGRGILLCDDELEGILSSVASDTKNGSGRGESQLLKLFDGKGNHSTRVSRDGGDFSASHVSLIGGIQPEVLKKHIKGGVDYSGKWARFLFLQLPEGVIRPPDHDPPESELRRRDEYRQRIRDAVSRCYEMPPMVYDLSHEARVKFNQWFIRHQERALLESTPQVVATMLRKSSAHALRIAGIHHVVWWPERKTISLESMQLSMEIVDQLFAEAEHFHRGDADLIDQLMDRIRETPGEVTWSLMRATRLDRFLKANARAHHFEQAVQNLLDNNEGYLTETKPVTWRQ